MSRPRVEIDLSRVEHNARELAKLCRRAGIEPVGVTKACRGMPEVGRAMLAGGVAMLADSRLENLRRLRDSGVECGLMLLRIPAPSAAGEVVALADVSLNSELPALEALSAAARRAGWRHRVIIMVELGDLREGFLPEEVVPAVARAADLPGLDIIGLGANLGCLSGTIPTRENLNVLTQLAGEVASRVGVGLPVISGGGTSCLPLVREGKSPGRLNQLRIGEGILLGTETVERTRIPGLYHNAFRIVAEIIEVKRKPSVPPGARGRDAMGRVRELADRGVRARAIAALGEQDVAAEDLTCELPGVEPVGASSDHLVLDVTDCPERPRVGEEVGFIPGYASLVRAMTSPYLAKVVVRGDLSQACSWGCGTTWGV